MIRKFKRNFIDRERIPFQRKILIGLTILLSLWSVGLLDKLAESSFDDFSWPAEHRIFTFPEVKRVPKCQYTDQNGKKLVILIKSATRNRSLRDAIRKTWGRYRYENNVEIFPVFIIGRSDSLDIEWRIDEEKKIYSDILSIEQLDTYRNNTYKLFASLNYALNPQNCKTPDFILLVDDDYFVHIPNLIALANSKHSDDLIYEGFVFDTSPFRFIFHKHRISLAEYPFSRYPPYVSAGAVFLTYRTVELFHKAIPQLKMFPFDDVYTGIVAKITGVTPTHNANFVFWPRSISKNEWDNGIIACHGYNEQTIIDQYSQVFTKI